MNKPIINLFDNRFAHAYCSTGMKNPRSFDYVKGCLDFDGITIFTDGSYEQVHNVNSRFNVAWQLESPLHSNSFFYRMVNNYQNKFDLILTYDEALIKSNPNKFKRCNFGGTTVESPNLFLNMKNKNVAIIHSGKNDSSNHAMRAIIAKSGLVDVHGKMTGRPFKTKEDVLSPYRFCIVIENTNANNYFSEKITDAIACGCIPIYNGCNNIGDYFDTNGMIAFRTLSELKDILQTLTNDLYSAKSESLESNFKIVNDQFYTNEDWLYQHYFKDILEKISGR